MKTPHIIPLSTQAFEVLAMLRSLSGDSEWLFPGERKGTMSNNTILVALERMGFKGVHTGHGFRGVASTLLHEQGFQHEHIELQLAHMPRNAVAPRTTTRCTWSHGLDDAVLVGLPGIIPPGSHSGAYQSYQWRIGRCGHVPGRLSGLYVILHPLINILFKPSHRSTTEIDCRLSGLYAILHPLINILFKPSDRSTTEVDCGREPTFCHSRIDGAAR